MISLKYGQLQWLSLSTMILLFRHPKPSFLHAQSWIIYKTNNSPCLTIIWLFTVCIDRIMIQFSHALALRHYSFRLWRSKASLARKTSSSSIESILNEPCYYIVLSWNNSPQHEPFQFLIPCPGRVFTSWLCVELLRSSSSDSASAIKFIEAHSSCVSIGKVKCECCSSVNGRLSGAANWGTTFLGEAPLISKSYYTVFLLRRSSKSSLRI